MEVAMMNNNGRPLSRKQTVRLLVALTILAWATQTLLHQWGFSQQIPTTQRQSLEQERFVPESLVSGVGATLELRPDATVIGAEVKLRQVCRWSDRDKALFDPIGDLVLVRLAPKTPFKSLSMQEIRGIMRDAGVNTASINFAGAITCMVSRSDADLDDKNGLDQWIAARQGKSDDPSVSDPAGPVIASAASSPKASSDPTSPVKTLRQALVEDLALRLNISADALQVDFKLQDENVLNVSQPLFRYDIEPVRVRTLGQVAWNVTISGGTDPGKRKIAISAEARAWQTQLVVSKPIAARQIIRPEDLMQRRTLVDQLSSDPLVTMSQTVGEQAGRELKPGDVLTGKMLDPVQLVKTGQFVTVTLDQGTVQVKAVARAMENGSYGQTIRAKNEATKEVLQVVVTGPQTATMNLEPPVVSAGQ
jgi:flagella basal body P-ring formation protein FlgA